MLLQTLAPWNPSFSTAIATELETEPFVTFSFANVDSKGLPHTRTCVFRGFLFDDTKTNVLTFTTDKRTSKYKDLCNNPNFEACFYFPKLRKQFRFSGVVKMVTDDTYPNIIISPGHHTHKDHYHFNMGSDDEYDDEDDESQKESKKDTSHIEDTPLVELEEDFYSPSNGSTIASALNYKILSPAQLKKTDSSYVSLHDLSLYSQQLQSRPIPERTPSNIASTTTNNTSSNDTSSTYTPHPETQQKSFLQPPTKQEWEEERTRSWSTLSRQMKRSFKRPPPGTLLSEEKYKLLDAINRGVDGMSGSTKEVDNNFVLVCMFVKAVDQVDLGGASAGGNDKRYLYKKSYDIDAWTEYEVCP